MLDERNELDIAQALAGFQEQRARGESSNVFAWRDRLGESHGEFVSLVATDTLIDEITDPPKAETLPRDFGKFQLVRELGRGAIGVVYEAVQTSLRRRAAVKILQTKFDNDPQSRDRFRREGWATAKVRHPHIVEIFDADEIDGRPFYAMAFVEGQSLDKLIAMELLPQVRELCGRFAGIADALHALHRAKPDSIVHRDVKPSNIMVERDGKFILADFGLARTDDGLDLTRTGVTVGTPLYMPPEQMLGMTDEIDERSDVYALGATIYEAISGRPVFKASSLATVAGQVKSERPAPLHSVAPGCPRVVEDIVMMALEKRREDRYQSAALMRDDLRAVAEGRDGDVKGKPVGRARRVLRWIVEEPAGRAVAAGALLAIGAGLFFATRPPPPASLEITSFPNGAEVLIGNRPRGRTPLTLPLEPGAYDVVVRLDGYLERSRHVELAAGASKPVDLALLPADENDADASLRAAGALDLDTIGYNTRRDRAGSPPVVLIYPRGNVRLSDLEQMCADVSYDSGIPEEGATLEFRRDGKTLYSRRFEPADGRTVSTLPASVREQLHVGDVVTWGVSSPGGARGPGSRGPNRSASDGDVFAKFTVVTGNPAADAILASIASKYDGLEATLPGELAIKALWRFDLNTAALIRADKAADAHKGSLLAQHTALRAYDKLGIRNTVRTAQLIARVDGFDMATQERVKKAAFSRHDRARPLHR